MILDLQDVYYILADKLLGTYEYSKDSCIVTFDLESYKKDEHIAILNSELVTYIYIYI